MDNRLPCDPPFAGGLFFIGFATRERYAREVIRSTALAEVGLALLFAILLHLCAWQVLYWLFDFSPQRFFRPLEVYDRAPTWLVLSYGFELLWPILWYVVATAVLGGVIGAFAAWMIVKGPLRFLATHKWVYQLLKFSGRRGRVVTAFVMTTTAEAGKILMYKGSLQELYLSGEGKVSYIVLRSCSRYLMHMNDGEPLTGTQLPLFKDDSPYRSWDYLMISGDHIANVLFDPSPEIEQTRAGSAALERAVAELTKKVDEVDAKLTRQGRWRLGRNVARPEDLTG
jgi:hypothetical protein